MTRALLLAVLLVVLAVPARAEVGGAPGVALALNTPLTETLHPTLASDVEQEFDVEVVAYLRVGDEPLGRIGAFAGRATNTPKAVALPVPDALRRRADAVGRRTGSRRAVVSFVLTGPGLLRTTSQTFVSLRPPVPTTGPTALGVGGVVEGARESVRGTVSAATPPGWLRTSSPRADPATFTVAAGPRCRVDVLAQAAVRAARSAERLVPPGFPAASRVRGGRTAATVWAVSRTAAPQGLPGLRALGVRRVASRRYAVLRLQVAVRPDCPDGAVDDPAVLDAVERTVRGMAARVRLG